MNRFIMAALLIAPVACGRGGPPEDQPTGSIDSATWSEARNLPADLRAALDSGNALFRADAFEAARVQYRRAVAIDPDESAGWFGLSMVERELGNSAAADSAMERVRAIVPGASLLHPADTAPAPPRDQ